MSKMCRGGYHIPSGYCRDYHKEETKMSEETYAKIEDHLVNMVAGEAKPIDVDYAMHLIHSYTQEKCREARIEELSFTFSIMDGRMTYILAV